MTTTTQPIRPSAAAIAELTNATFERVQPQFDRYATDPRRISESGGLLLDPNESLLYGPDRLYGRVALAVCDKQSAEAVTDALTGSKTFQQHFPRDRFQAPGKAPDDPEMWKPVETLLSILAVREQFRHGNTWVRTHRNKDADGNNGERHSIGFRLATMYRHVDLPLYEIHDLRLLLQHRFDKDWPQVASKYSAHVATMTKKARATYELPVGPSFNSSRITYGEEVKEMAGILALAKDVRPRVMPVLKMVEQQRQISAMMASLELDE